MADETVTAVATEPELLATDRCDSCGAQALVRVTFLTGMLYFAGITLARTMKVWLGKASRSLTLTGHLMASLLVL